jgi:hypothetical protein
MRSGQFGFDATAPRPIVLRAINSEDWMKRASVVWQWTRRARWAALGGAGLLIAIAAASALAERAERRLPVADDPAGRHSYFTGGVHNDVECAPPAKCVYPRKPGEPQKDPQYPAFWTSDWTMYRVFQKYKEFPPPYASPPAGLTPADYQVSYGATYYDATYVAPDSGGQGAMMEYYDKYCLPIFPGSNQFSCAFVSLGDKAYFLRYDDRPVGAPACCQFSLDNHPPRRDFIKHLPYSAAQSAHLGGTIQAYSVTVGADPPILFGYAFDKQARPDAFDRAAAAYQHPQSFFFSGQPTSPPDAPIVSQNYTSFRMERPDPAKTWDQVTRTCSPEPVWCCLFDSDCPDQQSPSRPAAARSATEWSTLGKRGASR